MAHPILMPKAGQSMTEGRVVTWLKKEGDAVRKGDPLMEIETDKANLEVEALEEGVLRRIFVAEGESCLVLAAVGVIGGADEEIDFESIEKQTLEKAKAEAAGGDSDAPPPAKKKAPPANAGGGAPPAAKRPARPAPRPAAPAAAGSAAAAVMTAPPPAPGAGAFATPPAPRTANGRKVAASPLARRLAAERGVDLAALTGSGPRGRILRRDVESAPASRPSRASGADAFPLESLARPYPPPGPQPADDVPFEGMRAAIAKALGHSKSNIPHFYTTVPIDMARALALKADLAARGERISVNDLVVRAVTLALEDERQVNCRVYDDRVEYPDPINIGIAVGSDDGLVVPVVLGAESLDLVGVARTSREVIAAAQGGKLVGTGQGTFTISNLGMFGVESFTAIINPPEGAILAVGATRQEMVVAGGGFFPRPVMRVTLSCDHRAIDGLLAARFLSRLKYWLETAELA